MVLLVDEKMIVNMPRYIFLVKNEETKSDKLSTTDNFIRRCVMLCYVIRRAAADGGGSQETAALGPRPQRVCYQTLCYVVSSDGQLLTAEVRRRPQLWDPGH